MNKEKTKEKEEAVFALAKMLGQALRKDDRLIRLEKARNAYENDETVAGLMTEYEVQQKALQSEAVKTERDAALVHAIQNRVDELYEKIVKSEAYTALEAAQNEVNELMNRVNAAITAEITGQAPAGGCTHDCKTCGGCH